MVERLARTTALEIIMTKRTRNYLSKCTQGKQSKTRESTKSTGTNAPPIDRISGIYSRISNFLDAKNKAAKPFAAFLLFLLGSDLIAELTSCVRPLVPNTLISISLSPLL